MDEDAPPHSGDDRRAFLRNAGRLAAIVPPAMTLLLSTSMNSPAIAQSGGFESRGFESGGSASGDSGPGRDGEAGGL